MLRKILVGLVATATSLIATPAGATDTDHSTVVWTMHGDSTPDHPFTETQTFLAFESENPTLACETWYQVDTYKPGHPFGTSVFTLTANGTPGGDQDWIKSWKFVYGGDCTPLKPEDIIEKFDSAVSECVIPANGTAVVTYTNTTTVTRFDLVNKVWVARKPVSTVNTATETVRDAGCSVTDNPTPTPEPKPHHIPKAPHAKPVHHAANYTG